MSNALFHDTVTLYTPVSSGGYERHVIKSVKILSADSDGRSEATVYIPLFGRRMLKYLPPSKWVEGSELTFTLNVGQLIVLGNTDSADPPTGALRVYEIDPKTTGSRRIQHIKIKASSVTATEEESNE